VFIIYVRRGLVPRLLTAVLFTGLMMLAALAIACGLVLDTPTRGRAVGAGFKPAPTEGGVLLDALTRGRRAEVGRLA